MKLTKQDTAELLIEEMGGTVKVAQICQITPASVSGWKKHGVPIGWQKYFSIAFPEVWAKISSQRVKR